MAMKLVKKTADYTIYQRGDNRYAVKDGNKNAVNGEDKARILADEGLIKLTAPSAPAAEEAPAEEVAAEEAPVEEAPVEEAAAEEPAAEEPAAEEPAAEEPAAEEEVAEEEVAEEEAAPAADEAEEEK